MTPYLLYLHSSSSAFTASLHWLWGGHLPPSASIRSHFCHGRLHVFDSLPSSSTCKAPLAFPLNCIAGPSGLSRRALSPNNSLSLPDVPFAPEHALHFITSPANIMRSWCLAYVCSAPTSYSCRTWRLESAPGRHRKHSRSRREALSPNGAKQRRKGKPRYGGPAAHHQASRLNYCTYTRLANGAIDDICNRQRMRTDIGGQDCEMRNRCRENRTACMHDPITTWGDALLPVQARRTEVLPLFEARTFEEWLAPTAVQNTLHVTMR